ncbi:MAG: aldo/keto reductase [Planctomycetaceae bacterium]|jgi:aryl-alcohol dehydrogenase-like predicted oxidoreductase|nr:aldo/keto reductase [Planctomycetaceae bacterium]
MSSFNCVQKLGIGTVQFGLNYGISNANGQVAVDEVARILRSAADSGVSVLDTAAAYGNSEEVLGRTLPEDSRFNIVTKVPKIGTETNDVRGFIRSTFERSLQRLRRKSSLYSLMFHDADDLNSDSADDAYQAVADLKAEGQIRKIGVSAYTQEQLEAVRKRFDIDLVQVPVNVFDQRLIQSGYLQDLHNNGIEVHSRSAFLQGLLLLNPGEVRPHFESVKPVLRHFVQTAKEHRITPLALALSFVLNINSISAVIAGVTSQKEFLEITDAAQRAQTEPLNVNFLSFRVDDTTILNPSLWRG